MNADEYQKLALRTATDGNFHERIINAALGLSGEAGEFADAVKKMQFQGHGLDRTKAKNELGDIAWYVALASSALGFSLSEVLQSNIDKLRERYPDGFDSERSVNRG
jgi:NTP pyrophosphatase (non-canonical NTP hydrolase)